MVTGTINNDVKRLIIFSMAEYRIFVVRTLFLVFLTVIFIIPKL